MKTLIINERLWIYAGGMAGFALLEATSLLCDLTPMDAFFRGCVGLLAGGYLARFLLRSVQTQAKLAAKQAVKIKSEKNDPPDAQ